MFLLILLQWRKLYKKISTLHILINTRGNSGYKSIVLIIASCRLSHMRSSLRHILRNADKYASSLKCLPQGEWGENHLPIGDCSWLTQVFPGRKFPLRSLSVLLLVEWQINQNNNSPWCLGALLNRKEEDKWENKQDFKFLLWRTSCQWQRNTGTSYLNLGGLFFHATCLLM